MRKPPPKKPSIKTTPISPISERELAAAERWQLKQAYATWQRHMRGEEPFVPWEEIEKIFADARAGQLSRPPRSSV